LPVFERPGKIVRNLHEIKALIGGFFLFKFMPRLHMQVDNQVLNKKLV